ncbi:MAG: ATP-dependent 26S proteasome regulatory subunit, partial [halophilic archaeon J07HB67]
SYALESAVDRSPAGETAVTAADLEMALAETEPSSLRGAAVERPEVSFDDVGGLDGPKRELTRSVEWPLRHPEAFDRLNIDAPTGVLLYGPPGTGKTLLARAVAATTDANFLPVDGPELLDKYVGESERAVRELFDRARANAPAVVFFDEMDALAPARTQDTEASAPERVASQLLTELDGLVSRGGITVIAATNRPDRLDPALLRPGRLDRLVEVPVPDETAREAIFRVHTRDRPVEGVDYPRLAAQTDGYTGSDIEAVVREASLLALERVLDGEHDVDPRRVDGLTVGPAEFDRALRRVGPSLTDETLANYEAVVEDIASRSQD